MQGQRSTIEQFPDVFEFNHGSSSNVWPNVPSSGDAQNLPEYLLTPSEPVVPYRNAVNQETENLTHWSLGSSSSMDPMTSRNYHVETKTGPEWISSLTGDASSGLEVSIESANMLSLDNVGINLNVDQVEQDNFLQDSQSNDASLGINYSACLSGNGAQVPHTAISPLFNPFVSEAEQIASSSCITNPNPDGTSSGHIGSTSENTDVRLGNSLDSRRISGKRKNIEGFSGQSSRSESHSQFHPNEDGLLQTVSSRHIPSSSLNISVASGNISSVNALEENLNQSYNAGGTGASDCLSTEGSSGSSQRNFRLRVNPANQADLPVPNQWSLGNSSRQHSVWSPHRPSALLAPLNQPLQARSTALSVNSQNQTLLSSASGLARLVHPLSRNGTSNLQIGSSSNSPSICSADRLATGRDETDVWGTQRRIIPEQSVVVPANDARHVTQVPTDWSLANDSANIPGNVASTSQASSSSGAQPTVTTPRMPHQSQSTQYEQPSEFVRGALSTASPDSVGLASNFLPQRSGHSSLPREFARQPGVGLRTHQQQLLRSAAVAFLADRRHDAVGAPVTLRMLAAAREGRNRFMSEHIRNALDLMRRGENIRFESAFHGHADLHDRHRDMRLDVDNMSYEELLALGERIGNVSTGLNEETIQKHLKQRKHLSITPSNEVEPCCICQEDYLDNEDIGTLDCGHDFHSACIKQWLIHKNICPICKTTALAT